MHHWLISWPGRLHNCGIRTAEIPKSLPLSLSLFIAVVRPSRRHCHLLLLPRTCSSSSVSWTYCELPRGLKIVMMLSRSIHPNLRPSLLLHCSFASSAAADQAERTIRQGPRNDWARDEIKSVYDSPVLDLLFYGVSFSLFLCIYRTLTLESFTFSASLYHMRNETHLSSAF